MASLFGGKTKREKAQEQTFNTQFQPLIQQQAGASKSALDFALPTLKQGTDTLQGPISYFKTLAGGDRTAISQLLGPQLDAISQRDAQQRQNFSQFAPRGSTMSNRLGELDQGTMSDLNRLFLSARPEAQNHLMDIAQLLFGTGISGDATVEILHNPPTPADLFEAVAEFVTESHNRGGDALHYGPPMLTVVIDSYPEDELRGRCPSKIRWKML